MSGGRNKRTRKSDVTCDNKLVQREDERVTQGEDSKRQCVNQLAGQDDERAAQREDDKRQCDNQLAR